MSVTAYQRARNCTESPRATEYRLLSQVTGALIDAREAALQGAALANILHWNREIWGTFSAVCADEDNRLPAALRAGLISLSLWVDRHSSAVIRGEGDIDDLIDINRSVMEGLRSND